MAVKVTVNLPDEAVAALKEYASKRGITMTEALRRFILREKFFDDEISEGNKLLIEKRDDKSLREVVLA